MINVILIAMAVVFLVGVFLVFRIVREKNVDLIVRAAMKRRVPQAVDTPVHVFFSLVDHFEPYWRGPSMEVAHQRVDAWHAGYATLMDSIRDDGGRMPQHTFFYPQEEYDPACLDKLADLSRRGCGDVEVHLHHDNDTSAAFREKIESFATCLHDEHGLLRKNNDGVIEYGFIHGNWALDDSGVDGRWCGVRDEITILRDTGCYADFTYPSAPHPSQPPMINQIYYATDDPVSARSHHTGTPVAFDSRPSGDLMLVTGPLALNWQRKRRGFMPAIESGDITGLNPATADRLDLWVRTAVGVEGYPSWVFVKVHTHGAQEPNTATLLSDHMAAFYRDLLRRYNDGGRHVVHFVTARQMYDCIKVLERGSSDAIQRAEAFDYGHPTP